MASQQQLQAQLNEFWQQQLELIQAIDPDKTDFKTHELPLARVKKIMKMDDEVGPFFLQIDPAGPRFMISAEAPALFGKACELFILELTLRSWTVTEESKRRTLQRSDVSQAVQRSDMYDFLIDIVPREELKQPPPKKPEEQQQPQQQQQQQQQQPRPPQHAMQLVDSSQYIYLQQQAPGSAQALQIQHLLWQQQLAQQAYVIQTQAVGAQGASAPPLPPQQPPQDHQPPLQHQQQMPPHQQPPQQQQQQPQPPAPSQQHHHQHQPHPHQGQQQGHRGSEAGDDDDDDDDEGDDDDDDDDEGEEEHTSGPVRTAPPLSSHYSMPRQDRGPPPLPASHPQLSPGLQAPLGAPNTQPMQEAALLPNGISSSNQHRPGSRGVGRG